jgi:hypothetical protein
MDAGTGRIVEGELPFPIAVYGGTAADGSIYVFPAAEVEVSSLKPTGDGFSSQEAHLDEKETIQQRYGTCVGELKGAVREAALKVISDANAVEPPICKKFGDRVLLTIRSHGSHSITRHDTLLEPDGTKKGVQELFSRAAEGILRDGNFSWVGMPAETRSAIGALLNRDAMVVADGSPILNYRHPIKTMPTHARFAGPDLLIVVDRKSGQLVAHDLAATPRREGPLFTTTNEIIGSNAPVTTLHRGTCVGILMRDILGDDHEDVLPDGRKLSVLKNFERREGEIRVMSDKSAAVVKLPNHINCLQFSADWRQMLAMQPHEVTLYDFDRVVASRSLTKGKIGAIEVSNLDPMASAFFVPGTGDVVTTDGSNRVLRWKREESEGKYRWNSSRQLYQGNRQIIYAEPDATGDRLLLIEGTDTNVVRGFLYSVRARQEWFDFGRGIRIAFNDKQEVVVSERGAWTKVFPVLQLSELVELANNKLTPACRPVNQGDYKSSPCWPTSLE